MKTDFKVLYKDFYGPKKGEFSQVKLPKLNYLMIDGKGDPNTSKDYVAAIETLYAVSYTLKFFSKNELDHDYTVPPLEGLWWADKDKMDAFVTAKKSDWKWTMMIMVPDWITKAQVKTAIAAAKAKKPEVRDDQLRLESLTEGLCVQIMHIGPYSEEGPTLAKLHGEYMPEHGLTFNGKHHEIYLGDPRKTAPAKLKTVLRQPVKKA